MNASCKIDTQTAKYESNPNPNPNPNPALRHPNPNPNPDPDLGQSEIQGLFAEMGITITGRDVTRREL